MNFFSNFFKKEKSSQYSEKDIDSISSIAYQLGDTINESLAIATDSNNIDTKLSRLAVAKIKLEELKNLEKKYSFVTITTLDEVEKRISHLETKFENSGLKEIAEGNSNGDLLEKEGKIEEAIFQYELLVDKKVDTPFTYRRLAILYRKSKRREDEIRILNSALENIPQSNSKHYRWFAYSGPT